LLLEFGKMRNFAFLRILVTIKLGYQMFIVFFEIFFGLIKNFIPCELFYTANNVEKKRLSLLVKYKKMHPLLLHK